MENSTPLLYARQFQTSEGYRLIVPTVGQILDCEQEYYSLVSLVSATPYDMMVQLDDAGIDFTQITDFELFCLLFGKLQEYDTSLLFYDLDWSGFRPAKRSDSGDTVLWNERENLEYNKKTHSMVCAALRKMHFMHKPRGRPGNEEARQYMIERMRIKQQRASRKQYQSQLEGLIVSLVCTEQYKYVFESTRRLSIYQFNSCVHQINRKIYFDNLMIGCYAGTIDTKNISQKDLNWFVQEI